MSNNNSWQEEYDESTDLTFKEVKRISILFYCVVGLALFALGFGIYLMA